MQFMKGKKRIESLMAGRDGYIKKEKTAKLLRMPIL